ncbi:MAG: methylenetetrahydrofolate--tRNA-(uracil(54)-C(5))-methyltransferase (FADH(2)-oxidizing) TrmFO [Deltaproteobacteria bacterium]|nr:methylenetetrahydrofolate--tRNA-(uracil(54)-C(5))-methyltransferase (FADH(2)-oxidizing) TrmFO [Deltaproteobacteria bacterium]MCB9488691.1 methylenetetrahydrofolate--tRNA-(uracil(54)-C(5))-methyltransferase (FADH(2)-oxidizing) TrmFO [Deltaproteobacteria bacterium]
MNTPNNNYDLLIVGAGLAGSEAAAVAARAGLRVRLVDQKPAERTPAQKLDGPAELVCSNSLGSADSSTAGGLLKDEMRLLGSTILLAADAARVPAGGALAVHREAMSENVRQLLDARGVSVTCERVDELPDGPCVIGTGPLTADALAHAIAKATGQDALFFFDATSPIVAADTIDMDIAYAAARWGKGDPDYINCPMTREEYEAFYAALTHAEMVTPHEFENKCVFEGCMPIEVMAARGVDTLRYGPMRPVGLEDPRTGKRPYAVVQLRKEDADGEAYNLVGFQTRMKWGDQQRVLRMIPGLADAEFLRLGVIHRNTFVDGPRVLDATLRLNAKPNVRLAGQMTGVEGYTESAACGLMAGLFAAAEAKGIEIAPPPETTMIGALLRHVTASPTHPFQPMNANLGILPAIEIPGGKRVGKKERRAAKIERALADFRRWVAELDPRLLGGPSAETGRAVV